MKRPAVTQEMKLKAAEKMCADLKRTDWEASDIASSYRHGMDGYELAKELESHHWWEISADDVGDLDTMGTYVREVHKAACVEWAATNNIQPPLPIGTMIKRGVIAGLCEHEPATYLIRQHGETNDKRFLLVKFEDAEAVDLVAA